MISFSVTQDPHALSPVGQIFCLGLLRSTKNLKGKEDASDGQVALHAAQGILSNGVGISTPNVLFVIDKWFDWRPNAQGIEKPAVMLELYLNKVWYRLGTRYVVAPARTETGSWESYQPVSIETISGPSALARAAFAAKVQPKAVPGPVMIIDLSESGQLPSSALADKGKQKAWDPVYV